MPIPAEDLSDETCVLPLIPAGIRGFLVGEVYKNESINDMEVKL